MKPGRNDPCPCSSGKKYKHCCLKAEQAQPGDDFLWRRIRRVISGSPMRMLDFAAAHFGAEALLEAWEDFMPHWEDEEDEPFTMDTPHLAVFMSWFFYEWLPSSRDTAVKRQVSDRRSVGQAYLDRKRRQFDPLLARYIEQCCTTPFGFYDILSVRPGRGFTVRDIFSGEELEVFEQSGSQHSQVGDLLFGKLVTLDGVSLLEACAPFMFPPIEKDAVLKLRRKMERRNKAITPEVLREYRYEMLYIYHDIVGRLLSPPMPQLQNTDGDPLLLSKLVYDLECTPRVALNALRQLNITEDDESLLIGAKFDPSGELREIKFSWEKAGNEIHQGWNNTILGHISIAGATLCAEVNSENRAQQFKTLMEKLLPGKARYKTTVMQSPQAMLKRMREENGPTAEEQELDELNNRPEVQALIAEHLRQHYRGWVNQKIPALNNQTPLQAVKTRDGKEMVEALLMDIERRNRAGNMPFDPGIMAELREKLGLS